METTNNADAKKVELTPQEFLSITCDDSYELAEEDIFSLIEKFQYKQDEGSATRNVSSATSLKIKRKYYLKDYDEVKNLTATRAGSTDLEAVPVFEVNFTRNGNNGLAIVSGDKRAPYILAYIEKINDTDSLYSGPKSMLDWAQIYAQADVEEFEAKKEEFRESAIIKLSSGLGIAEDDVKYERVKDNIVVSNGISTRSTPVGDVPIGAGTTPLSVCYPVCPVTWDQTTPYNCKLPMADVDIFFGWTEYTNVPSGCGVVAVAHALACVQPTMRLSGVSMNWAYLTENPMMHAPDYFTVGDPQAKRDMVGYLSKRYIQKQNLHLSRTRKALLRGQSPICRT